MYNSEIETAIDLLNNMLETMVEKDFPKQLAKFYRDFYTQLTEQGFTSEQAVKIITNMSPVDGKK